MKFISATEKAYNIEIRKERLIKKLLKNDKKVDIETLEKIISIITAWSICKFNNAAKDLYNDSNLLRLANEDQKLLLSIFDMNTLMNNLRKVLSDEEYLKFTIEDNYRREIMKIVLLDLINKGGKTLGAEYGLVFAKTYSLDLSIPMHYASYDEGIFDPKLKEFIDTYLKAGGSKNVYWLPTYYSDNKKSKYSMEELEFVMSNLQIRQYVKK